MSKRKIIGLCMAAIGAIYMFFFFAYPDIFEKIDDTLCFLMTVSSAAMIILGIGMFIFKTPEEHFEEESIKREENEEKARYEKSIGSFSAWAKGVNAVRREAENNGRE